MTAPATSPDVQTSPQSAGAVLFPTQGKEVRVLTAEERNDLRKRVLAGKSLTLDEARDVLGSLRQGAAVAVIAGEGQPKSRKPKKEAMSDEALDKDLDDLLK